MRPATYRRLTQAYESFKTGHRRGSQAWVEKFLDALDWTNTRAGFSTRRSDELYQLSVDGRNFLNVLPSDPTDHNRVAALLNRSYNEDVPWVLATNFDAMALFGSYWISSEADLTSAVAWSLTSEDYLLESDKLGLLTPENVALNRIGDLYEAYSFRPRRLPIDIHLLERMAQWRSYALDSLPEVKSNDDALVHRLISNLFLVRYLEDSGLITIDLRALSSSQVESLGPLRRAFSLAREVVGDSALPALNLNKFRASPLKTLIAQLYGYEAYKIQYDFKAMSVDVLGRFYEEYLRNRPTPLRVKEVPAQPLFLERKWEFSDVRRERGIYYTPKFIVDYLVNDVLERAAAEKRTDAIRILDLACGSGTFLAAAIDWFANHNLLNAKIVGNISGTDIDPRAIEAARVNITARAVSAGIRYKQLDLRLETYDLIERGVDSQFFEEFLPKGGADVIFGNPPFINYETLSARYDPSQVEKMFVSAKGRFDSHLLFLEAAVELLQPGGFCGIVLPSSFLRSAAGATLRKWIEQRAELLEIVDFGDQPVFQGVAVYVCLVVLRKILSDSRGARPQVSVAKIRRLSATPGVQLAGLSVQNAAEATDTEVFLVPQPKGAAPWTFRNPDDQRIIEKIRNAATRLGDTQIDVRQGIKTGADKVFVISLRGSEFGRTASTRSPSEMLLPVLRGRDIGRWFSKPLVSVIYPYDLHTRKLLPWRTVCADTPEIATYLSSHRKALERRKGTAAWYALTRSRLETVTMKRPMCFISELSVWPSACISEDGDVGILGGAGGGSWLVFTDDTYDVLSVMAYINSTVAFWLLHDSAHLRRGGWLILDQSTLSDLLVPNFLRDPDSFARKELAAACQSLVDATRVMTEPNVRPELRELERRIDALIVQGLGLSASEADYVITRAGSAGFFRHEHEASLGFALE